MAVSSAETTALFVTTSLWEARGHEFNLEVDFSEVL